MKKFIFIVYLSILGSATQAQVDPDIVVDEDLAAMARGIDPQLERAITEIKNAILNKGYNPPKQPGYEKRN